MPDRFPLRLQFPVSSNQFQLLITSSVLATGYWP
jgi:hypothetical protein